MKLDFRQRLLTTTLLVGAGVLASPAFAQAQPATQDQNASEAPPPADVAAAPAPAPAAQQEIIITGTRIPQPNLTSAAPVTVVSGEDVKLTGSTRIEDVLNQLPSVMSAQASGVSNGATGTANVNLRGLGSKRTLVLVNGRRLVPGDPNSTTQAADLNFIPAALIKRVDVLTGGASSVYGADAVSGVVNFILDTQFTGIRFDGQYSFYQHNNDCPSVTGSDVCTLARARQAQGLAGFDFPEGSVVDGGTFDGTVSMGAAFDDNRGHAMAYFGYRHVNPITQQRRDYSACGLSGSGAVSCGGSATSGQGNALLYNNAVTTGTSTFFTFGPNRTLVNDVTLYNFNPTNFYMRNDERYTAGAFADYEVTPAIHPYMEFMFMDDHTLAQIAPSGDFGNTFTLNCDNPFMSAQAQSIVCSPENMINGFLGTFPLNAGQPFNTGAPGSGTTGPLAPPITFFDARGNTYNQGYFNLLRRNVEGGNRIADLKHTEWRGVLGTKGDLSNVWSYDAYFQYGRTNYSLVYRNEFSARKLQNALNVVNVDANGVVVPVGTPGSVTECRSVLDNSDPACVPYDIFGTPSQAAVNYLNVFGVVEGTTSEQVANANITGQLGEMGIQTPWSDEGVGINVGTEYRKEALTLNPDQSFQQGDLTGQGAATLPVSGNFRVLEVFGEAQLPIIRHSFIDELSFGLGYRKSWYKLSNGNSFDTDTYKLEARFAPIRDIQFRGAYNRAVRAPNIQELFAPQIVALDGVTDPCAGITVTAADFGCLAQGMVVGQGTPENPAAQYNGFVGGDPNLQPEKATTKTLGVVLQPRFIPRLAVTVDWYDIKVKEAIQGFGADAILTNCMTATATFTPASCALVHRNPAGSLWLSSGGFVIDLPHNVGGVETRGIDGNVTYSHRLGALGTLSANFNGTWVDKFVTNDGLNPEYDCVGLYGPTCGQPLPEWRHKLRATLQLPVGIGISAQWRYVGSVDHEHSSSNPVLTGTLPLLSPHVKAQNYFDLATTFTVGDHYNFRMGVNNIFDRNPPLFTSSQGSQAAFSNGNTYPGVYDALGRYIYAGATLNF
ncbi:MAG TPA: TonB-dependent receptor [Sphingomicrobium sp.]|jgi:outer membrane receptor protein involved in Fe transport|nr:TonB-dependent receptor [Sphingomicrobium sp.]